MNVVGIVAVQAHFVPRVTRLAQENFDKFILHDASTSPHRKWAKAHALSSELGDTES